MTSASIAGNTVAKIEDKYRNMDSTDRKRMLRQIIDVLKPSCIV